ncbi:hypothetical protein WS71_23705 [Burkholderia mayonis]|uniref:Uncharacterized protein n=1 Tax=Burkholderia mayonis TaxID=1385591 RepID=A0A1B4G2S4_9BURK|nr:hypothetical protein WS71_23705 [Burkholderia mayonis]KVE53791.1 hypothetical protein WS71_07060 [Burkholderia mayonis]
MIRQRGEPNSAPRPDSTHVFRTSNAAGASASTKPSPDIAVDWTIGSIGAASRRFNKTNAASHATGRQYETVAGEGLHRQRRAARPSPTRAPGRAASRAYRGPVGVHGGPSAVP